VGNDRSEDPSRLLQDLLVTLPRHQKLPSLRFKRGKGPVHPGRPRKKKVVNGKTIPAEEGNAPYKFALWHRGVMGLLIDPRFLFACWVQISMREERNLEIFETNKCEWEKVQGFISGLYTKLEDFCDDETIQTVPRNHLDAVEIYRERVVELELN
jgi:hypothetical protein